jgi:hypothetical protein
MNSNLRGGVSQFSHDMTRCLAHQFFFLLLWVFYNIPVFHKQSLHSIEASLVQIQTQFLISAQNRYSLIEIKSLTNQQCRKKRLNPMLPYLFDEIGLQLNLAAAAAGGDSVVMIAVQVEELGCIVVPVADC